MSDDRSKKASRRQRTQVAIERQKRIAKSVGLNHVDEAGENHRFAKMHATNCGDPGCYMCGNPRKFFNERTFQERKFIEGHKGEDS